MDDVAIPLASIEPGTLEGTLRVVVEPSPWFLAAIGLALIGAAAVRQIIHGWRRHGLTHTLYSTLLGYAIGSGILAWVAAHHAHPVIAAIAAGPALVALAAWWRKLRAHGRSRRWIR